MRAPQTGKDSTTSFFSLQLVDLLHKLAGHVLLFTVISIFTHSSLSWYFNT